MFWAAECQLRCRAEEWKAPTFLVVGSRRFAEPQRLVAIAHPGTPGGVRRGQRGETAANLSGAHMKLGFVPDRDLAERRLPKLCAFLWDREAPALEVADGQAGCVRVDKVANLPAAVGENGRLVLAVHELAVVDEQAGGHTMAEGLRFEFLELAQRDGVDVGQRVILESL